MDQSRASAIAEHMLRAYASTADLSQHVTVHVGTPPTRMAKVHLFRGALQARLTSDAQYELDPSYVEHGRVGFRDVEHGDDFLLKSASAAAWDIESGVPQLSLFPPTPYLKPSGVTALVYNFDRAGLRLAVAPTTMAERGKKLTVSGELVPIGEWRYVIDAEDVTPFDQDLRDRFDDLGDLGDQDDAGGWK